MDNHHFGMDLQIVSLFLKHSIKTANIDGMVSSWRILETGFLALFLI